MTKEPGDFDALAKALEATLTPILETFVPVAREAVWKLSHLDGWSEAQCDWLAQNALEPMLTDLAAAIVPEEAFFDAYAKAREAYAVATFEKALSERKSRDVAFLMLVELEGLLSDRRGEARTYYSDALLMAGCAAVKVTAQEGKPSVDQIAAGFAMMRKLAEEFPDDGLVPLPPQLPG